jgi:DNA-directed RNA polymerase specialized sigma24 family protein
MLDDIAREHKLWIKMSLNMGVPNWYAEDLVQSMYVRIHNYVKDESKVYYRPNKINHFFIWTTLKNMWITYVNKAKRNPFKEMKDVLFEEEWYNSNIMQEPETEQMLAMDRLLDKIREEVDSWDYWYDTKLFQVYFLSHIGMRQLSRDTGISLSSIYNSIKKYKEIIREKFSEDWEDYKNQDFDLI